MPGVGINVTNAEKICTGTGVTELHLSGKTTRKSQMQAHPNVQMGINQETDLFLGVTCAKQVENVVSLFT